MLIRSHILRLLHWGVLSLYMHDVLNELLTENNSDKSKLDNCREVSYLLGNNDVIQTMQFGHNNTNNYQLCNLVTAIYSY